MSLETQNKKQNDSYENGKKPKEDSEAENQPSLLASEKSESGSISEPEELNWEEEAKKYQDLYIRATAEQENVRKRLNREKDEVIKFANENLIQELLPIMDNLERAIDHAENDGSDQEGVIEGVRMTYQAFQTIMEKFGVQTVAALGEKFDPQYHEAIMQEEDPDSEDGTVIKEIQKGYLLKNRLIRPAVVIVSKRTKEKETNGHNV
ncbi:MAG: nucleotide exchange factor GrpE [Deltaproteobacteria bacterium]|nr:nucleotide exchange factor GrpE [Deltaproteobacteria bacterium]MBW2052183.1 nucleotide exchange factor GrpE [Deltaproteobacteria bacterium]MBW2141385.1 nucleotide exchange factor GrpE [Deltaproteobacteria bacterium]MBW2323536.1 nucleotide exchange factor GrpE [Deltaproteobacteria bacterium]